MPSRKRPTKIISNDLALLLKPVCSVAVIRTTSLNRRHFFLQQQTTRGYDPCFTFSSLTNIGLFLSIYRLKPWPCLNPLLMGLNNQIWLWKGMRSLQRSGKGKARFLLLAVWANHEAEGNSCRVKCEQKYRNCMPTKVVTRESEISACSCFSTAPRCSFTWWVNSVAAEGSEILVSLLLVE